MQKFSLQSWQYKSTCLSLCLSQESGRIFLSSIISCTRKWCGRPRSPSGGIRKSFLHIGQDTLSPGDLSWNWPWRHLRQNTWRHGSPFGLSNSSRQIGHVVLSVDMDAAVAMALVYYVKIYLSAKTRSSDWCCWKTQAMVCMGRTNYSRTPLDTAGQPHQELLLPISGRLSRSCTKEAER